MKVLLFKFRPEKVGSVIVFEIILNYTAANLKWFLTQYIGETGRPFIERWKEHLYDIKVKRPYPVARHFNENDDHKKATFYAKIWA